jgi:hypothetical protein
MNVRATSGLTLPDIRGVRDYRWEYETGKKAELKIGRQD